MKQYLDLLQNIIDNGVEKESGRANMPNTIGISKGIIEMNLQDGFPLLTTKKMFLKGIIHELLWFLRGETNIKYLVDNNVNIWNGDAYRFFQERLWLLPDIENITMEEFLFRVKEEQIEKKFHYKYGDLGPVYGHNWRNYNGNIDYYHIGKKPNVDITHHKTHGFGNKGKSKGVKKHPLFQTWRNMISRCYNYNDPSFSKYGGKGVYVSDEWLNFDNFKEDVKELLNYKEKLENSPKYQLDKDSLGGKYYSKETCVWLNIKDNARLIMKNFEYVISNGEKEITTTNIEGTAKILNIEPTNLNRVCNGVRKNAGGWFLIEKRDFSKGYDQILNIVNGLKENPYSRYHVLDGWNPIQRKLSALAPCHLLYQFIVRPLNIEERRAIWTERIKGIMFMLTWGNGKTESDALDEQNVPKFYLDLNLYQRSCDTFLGVPFNLASMSLLLMLFAKLNNMIAGVATWIGGDTHLYVNHIDLAKEQIKREPYELPKLFIKKELLSFNDILCLTIDDFELTGYQSHPAIKGELFTGLKK